MAAAPEPPASLLAERDDAAPPVPHSRTSSLLPIVVSGVGFFSDAYDLFVINIVMAILDKEFATPDRPKGIEKEKAYISTAVLIGAVLGQLFFGLLADRIGRRLGFIITLSLVIFGAILSALAFPVRQRTLIYSLTVFRFILGFGIGGEYPLSATVTAESAATASRGRSTAAVFSMQGLGSFAAASVGCVLLYFISDLESVWRLCLGLGAVPGICILYFRWKMHETARFASHAGRAAPATNYARIFRLYWRRLLGTAGCWFLLDVVFYPNVLFSATLLNLFGFASSLQRTAMFNVMLTLMALPGYWTAIYLLEHPLFGRRNTQLWGFLALSSLFALIAVLYPDIKSNAWAFLILYGVTFFITNAGPNTTTFVLPSEVFPTAVRATLHGISAAAGKLGAVVGSAAMGVVANREANIPYVFIACSVVALLGAILTFFCVPETLGKSLEQLTAEVEASDPHEQQLRPVSYSIE